MEKFLCRTFALLALDAWYVTINRRRNNVGLGRCASPGLLVMRPAQSQQKRTLKRQYCRKNDLLTLNANLQELSVERLFSFDYVETHFPGW